MNGTKKKLAGLLAAMLVMLGASVATAELTDGSYAAAGAGKNGDVNVTVTIENGAIASVEVGDHAETAGICEAAIERIPAAIVENQSVAVDTVSGATVTSEAIIDAVKSCIEQAGGDVNDYMTAVQKPVSEATEEYDCDVVVVGAGAAGSTAAWSASENGAKVVVMEKAASAGGSGAMSMGMGAQGSAQQAAAGADFTVSEWLTDWLKQQNYMVSAPMIYTYISESGKTVDWLVENGADITFVGHAQEALAENRISTYHTWGEGGFGAVAANLVNKVQENGGVVLTETTGEEVLMENGAVAGVKGTKADGTTVIVHAKSVVLATGGYGADADRMVELLGQKVNGINTGMQTGDGIAMGQAVGAALDGEGNVEYHGAHAAMDTLVGLPNGGASLNNMAILPATLWVDVDGYRFTNEDICYDSAYIGNVTAQAGDHYYVLFSQKMLDTLSEQGEAGLGMTMAGAAFGAPGPAVDEAWATLKDEVEAGLATGATYKADTLEELAAQAGINAANLVKTVETYNAYCEAGVDGMYSKDSQFLCAIEDGPYYVVTGRATELCTLGGLKISTDFEVVNTENAVIPGLYSAGVDCSGSLYNNSYVSYEGVTMGWCTTSGRLAGANAAAYATK